MAITIKYFGAIAEEVGLNEEVLDLEKAGSVEALRLYCLAKYQTIQDLSFQIAVNQSLSNSGTLSDGDEVALLPPFAGG